VPGNDGEPFEILAKVGEHYVPDAATLDVDLSRFEAALGDATRASDDAMTVEALSRAIASYGGDPCPDRAHRRQRQRCRRFHSPLAERSNTSWSPSQRDPAPTLQMTVLPRYRCAPYTQRSFDAAIYGFP
jgi:hypothetical protein